MKPYLLSESRIDLSKNGEEEVEEVEFERFGFERERSGFEEGL